MARPTDAHFSRPWGLDVGDQGAGRSVPLSSLARRRPPSVPRVLPAVCVRLLVSFPLRTLVTLVRGSLKAASPAETPEGTLQPWLWVPCSPEHPLGGVSLPCGPALTPTAGPRPGQASSTQELKLPTSACQGPGRLSWPRPMSACQAPEAQRSAEHPDPPGWVGRPWTISGPLAGDLLPPQPGAQGRRWVAGLAGDLMGTLKPCRSGRPPRMACLSPPARESGRLTARPSPAGEACALRVLSLGWGVGGA